MPDQPITIDFSIEHDTNIPKDPTSPLLQQPGIGIVSTTRIVSFNDEKGNTICQVLYDKEKVNNQARKYADQGKKLSLADGIHFTWDACFDTLDFTKTLIVNIATTIQPYNGKRRRLQALPERFIPAIITEEEDQL